MTAIAREIVAGKFPWRADLEDVHMNIEDALTRREPAGAKLHTGRSRNDQGRARSPPPGCAKKSTALRLDIHRLQQVPWSNSGRKYSDVIIPGYTHLQRAQPVYFAHHLLAYVEMLERDQTRLLGCYTRTNVCPLGSGALAGSTLPLDREMVRPGCSGLPN